MRSVKNINSVKDLEVSGKRVMVRVDYNIPMDENLNISDDNRILATLPLIEYLIENRAKIILISHMGRPGGKVTAELSLSPAAIRLSELLSKKVFFVDDCVGEPVQRKVSLLLEGEILLLENLRFHDGEKSNDVEFAKALAELCDIYINDAFAVSHRKQASVAALPRLIHDRSRGRLAQDRLVQGRLAQDQLLQESTAAGFLLKKEIQCYQDAVQHPKRPLVAIIGGAKVSSKLAALHNMINYVDALLVGGAMANTFLKSQGVDVGASMVEEDLIETALDILRQAEKRGVQLLLPVDLVVAQEFNKDAEKRTVNIHHEKIPEGWMALDIGEESSLLFSRQISEAATIVWNGPMGVFEMEPFCNGTKSVAQAIASADGAFSIIGGGDTGLAAKVCGVAERVSYISTGGGAFLHLMEGKELPGVAALAGE